MEENLNESNQKYQAPATFGADSEHKTNKNSLSNNNYNNNGSILDNFTLY